jgi:hypothetical protein
MASIRRGIAVDVESIKSDRKHPEKSGLKCVTVLDFEFDDDFVGGHTAITFEEEALPLLREKLAKHTGIILGHNLFTFDFRVLSSRIKLDGIIEKMVDIRAWFEERTFEPDLPFSFNSIVKHNLDDPAIPSTTKINRLWLTSRRDQVFESNQNDCINLLTLWGKMIFKRELNVPLLKLGRAKTIVRRFRINDVDRQILLGHHFYFDTKTWNRCLRFPATDFSWARSIRDQHSAIACGANRKENRYEAVRCRNSAKAAVFYVERYRSFKLNRRFLTSQFAPDLIEVELTAASAPVLIGYTSTNVLPFRDATMGTLYSGKTTECYRSLPPCVIKHIESVGQEIDDPRLYEWH